MATELLRTTNDTSVQHTPAHDLESFVYLLCWIVTLYNGPKANYSAIHPKSWLWRGGTRVMI